VLSAGNHRDAVEANVAGTSAAIVDPKLVAERLVRMACVTQMLEESLRIALGDPSREKLTRDPGPRQSEHRGGRAIDLLDAAVLGQHESTDRGEREQVCIPLQRADQLSIACDA